MIYDDESLFLFRTVNVELFYHFRYELRWLDIVHLVFIVHRYYVLQQVYLRPRQLYLLWFLYRLNEVTLAYPTKLLLIVLVAYLTNVQLQLVYLRIHQTRRQHSYLMLDNMVVNFQVRNIFVSVFFCQQLCYFG